MSAAAGRVPGFRALIVENSLENMAADAHRRLEDVFEGEDEDETAIVSEHLSPGHATTDLDMAELITSDAELPGLIFISSIASFLIL
nr:hypothetical protein Iba_chr03aCG1790 [Ipomoea batatas]